MAKSKKKSGRAQYHAPTAAAVPAESTSPIAVQRSKAPRPDAWSGETRGATFLTIGWMFSTLATLLSLFIWLGVWWYIGRGSELPNAGLIMMYTTVFALATGLVTVVLGIVVNRLRQRPAPASIRRFASIVGALPWAIYATMFLFSR
jgi:hypothetical protein